MRSVGTSSEKARRRIFLVVTRGRGVVTTRKTLLDLERLKETAGWCSGDPAISALKERAGESLFYFAPTQK